MAHLFEGGTTRWGVALMSKTRLFVVRAGGHGRSIAEAAELSGQFEVVGFLDDAAPVGERVLVSHVRGPVASMADHCSVTDHVIVAIGNNAVREKLMQQLTEAGYAMATVVHPRPFVSPTAVVGQGSTIMAGAIVGSETRLGKASIVNCGRGGRPSRHGRRFWPFGSERQHGWRNSARSRGMDADRVRIGIWRIRSSWCRTTTWYCFT